MNNFQKWVARKLQLAEMWWEIQEMENLRNKAIEYQKLCSKCGFIDQVEELNKQIEGIEDSIKHYQERFDWFFKSKKAYYS